MENPSAIDEFIKFYNNFSVEDSIQFDAVYAENIVFVDPFHKITGQSDLFQYFKKLTEKVPDCHFDIHGLTYDKKSNKETGSAMLIWDMHFKHKQLRGGSQITVNGATYVEYADKVTFHRDYFDSAQLLYRNIPVLGSVIRLIERGL